MPSGIARLLEVKFMRVEFARSPRARWPNRQSVQPQPRVTGPWGHRAGLPASLSLFAFGQDNAKNAFRCADDGQTVGRDTEMVGSRRRAWPLRK